MEEKIGSIWRNICNIIHERVSPDTFERWFSSTELASFTKKEVVLKVPNKIYQLWIESNYEDVLREAVQQVTGESRAIEFVLSEKQENNTDLKKSGEAAKDFSLQTETEEVELEKDVEKKIRAAGLNFNNTFAMFVVGANNHFSHAAALAVSQKPAKTYNPLFIYGGVGLGKTHLMQAIGHAILRKKKRAKVVYISSEKFVNEFIDAIQNGTSVPFRKKYREADVLLIDDVQFLSGKRSSQEEFFHTFNSLFDGHKQIVLSSDRPPSEISNLEARLVSRFEWGLTAEIQAPDVETRIAILRKKMHDTGVTIDEEIVEFLADRIRTNVRRLEGGLMRIASYASLSGRKLTLEIAEKLLRDILQEQAKKAVTIDTIQKKVAEYFDIRLADMTSKRRPAHIAFPRQVAMYLAREHTRSSLCEIGEAFGGRDHGTVIHACRNVQKRVGQEEKLRQTIHYLDEKITQ